MKNINSISSFLLITIILVITAIGACKDYKQKTFNYIEMSTRFKHCIVVDKYQDNAINYVTVYNTFTKKYQTINVTDNLYYNVYFIGDTIK